MIAVCMPSRGLIHSRTVEALAYQLQDREWRLYVSHDLPIPDCFNDVTSRALEAGATRLLFVEEDMLLPPGIIDDILSAEGDIVTANYPVAVSNPIPVVQTVAGKTLCGTGLTLIKRYVFEQLGTPYFRNTTRDGNTLQPLELPGRYGGHDIDFCVRAQEAGFNITVIDKVAGQYRVIDYGKYETNDGSHNIKELVF